MRLLGSLSRARLPLLLAGRQPVDSKPPLKEPLKRPGRLARFARETLKTAATLLILVLAVLAALVIWDSYVTAPWGPR
jgi:hypothetical protein